MAIPGSFPEPYLRRATFLQHIPFDLDAATRAVRAPLAPRTRSSIEGAYPDGRGHEVTDWLVGAGARVTAKFGSDKLLTLR